MAATRPDLTADVPRDAIMTPTQMEPPPEQATLEASEPASPPAPRPPAFRAAAWRPIFQSRERRWWTAALAVTLLITAIGLGVLYVDDSNNQATIHSLQMQNESLTGRNQILLDQLKTTQTNLTATLGELATTKAELEHPHLVLWNVPQDIADNHTFLAGGIPDTFTYHLQATSTGPMSVSILTFQQFAKAVECIDFGTAVTNWCMHHSGAVYSQLGVTSVNYDFHLAEGCADYLAVFTAQSAVTVKPNITVTYNPASTPTGDCS
jgi:hypothetical protein